MTLSIRLAAAAFLAIGVQAALPGVSLAQAARVVVLPKHVCDGKAHDEAALEASIAQALQERGTRIVDLDSALRAQRVAFSDTVQAGKLPSELSVLNADVVASYQLNCDKSADSTWGTKLQAYYCVLSSKLIRVDSGDVVFSGSHEFTGHGLNANMAVQQVLKQLGVEIQKGAEQWLAQLAGKGTWNVDLLATGIESRSQAKELAQLLSSTKGVAARLLVFQPRLTKYALSGDDPAVLEGLADALERNAAVPLQITYEAGRVLHAQLDFGRAYSFGVLALSVSPNKDADGALRAQAADLLSAELSNLQYLDPAPPYRPFSITPSGQVAQERALLQKARDEHLPLVLVSSLLPSSASGHEIACALKLLSATQDGRVLAAASVEAASASEALEAARIRLDDDFRRALASADVQAALGVSADVTRIAAEAGLKIDAFTATPTSKGGARAKLTLRNLSSETIADGTISFQATDAVLGQQPLAELRAGGTTTIEVPLASLPQVADDHVEIAAVVAYRDGEVYRRVLGSATLIPTARAIPKPYIVAVNQAWDAVHSQAYDKARALAKKAQSVVPTAKALMVIGFAEMGLTNYRDSLRYLQEALDAKSYPLQASDRRLARKAVAAIKKELGEAT